MNYNCPICDGGTGAVELGVLGNLQHLRCIDCGLDFHVEVYPEKPNPEFKFWRVISC
jgi:transposase-like protein